MGIAAKRRKGNAVPLGMKSDWRPIRGWQLRLHRASGRELSAERNATRMWGIVAP